MQFISFLIYVTFYVLKLALLLASNYIWCMAKTKKEESNMGRNPLPEGQVKKRVVLFIKQETLDAWGGEAKLKAHLINIAETTTPVKK